MPIAEKIKQVAPTFPHIAIPARAICAFQLIHLERWVTILAVAMMFPKGIAPQPTPIELDIATDHLYEKSKVDQLARELRVFVATREKNASVFVRATKEDVPEYAKISDAIFGAHFDVERQNENTQVYVAQLQDLGVFFMFTYY